jgi:FtsP/CotA-like multicopper oxidase with cupredoxin domain
MSDASKIRRASAGRRPASGLTRLSRRRVLGGVIGAAGFGMVAGGGRSAWSAAGQTATPTPFATGEPFAEPPVLRSADGRLDVALEARYGPATTAGRDVTTYSYNGHVPGPTLRLRPGETLGISLTNRMDEMTNFHTHGLHVSPSGNSDNVLALFEPNVQVDLAFDIPRDGTSGLYIPGFYWYHPHLHGTTSEQVNGGMAGALIIEGALDELPELKGLTERLFILRAATFDDDGSATLGGEPTLFVNNQVQPTVPIAPGETQRWRIVNASVSTFMNLALDGHVLHQIASDGNPLREVRSHDEIVIAPGERVEVLVQGGAAGRYSFRSLPWGQDLEFQAQPEYPIATLVSEGPEAEPAPLPTTLFPFEDLRQAAIDRRRELVFSATLNPFAPVIDGHPFDHDRVDQRVKLGATEEWVLRNTSSDTHPFHIHVNDFQVVSINGDPVDADSWEDTTPIPAFGEIVIRTRFLDFTGKYVYHCHILEHEDLGMMGIVEVVE